MEPAAGSPTSSLPDPLARYRALQVASILLASAGPAVVLGVVAADLQAFVEGRLPTDRDRLLAELLVAGAGGLAFVVGIAMNAVRAIVVRSALPAARYRGPSIIVLFVVATLLTSAASVSLGGEVATLLAGGRPTLLGSALVLTVTQLGLLVAGAGFVATPRALAGLRVVPTTRRVRDTLVGLGLALPAWIGAGLLGFVVVRALGAFGIEPQLGLADAAIERADPIVLIIALVVVAPIAEELFFRGIVFNAWEREYGTRRAVLGSAILFAAIHGSIFALLPILGLGIVLAILYRETRSLAATVALHAGFNGLTVLVALLDRFGVITLPT